jgi:hypothetical protein
MKELYVFNSNGINELIKGDFKDEVLEGIEERDWEEVVGFKSLIIERYRVFDGLGRIEVVDNIEIDRVLLELEKIDFELWG